MNWFAILIISAGVFSIVGAVMDWEWFMTHRKVRLFVSLLGRTGARILYAGLGIAIIVFGVMAFMQPS